MRHRIVADFRWVPLPGDPLAEEKEPIMPLVNRR